jgi:Sulfotransferase family
LNSQPPVFICGALRSGTTLLHLMLHHHPDIINPGEFDFMFDFVKNDNEFPDPKDYHEFLDKDRIFKSHNLQIDPTLNFSELLHSFVSQINKENDVLALNVHRNFQRIPYLFPEAKYIHLLRDPRDVARSSIEMGWRGNVYYGVEHWIATELSWDVLEKALSPEQYTTLYYEKLIENPEIVLNDLCRFLGVPYNASMLDYPLHSTYKKPDKSLIQQWKHKLSQREVQYVEAKAGHIMVEKGFQMSGFPSIQIGSMEKLKLALQNKFYRINFGLKKYGLVLYTIEKTTKFLGLKELNKKYFLMKEEVNKKHLR